MNVQGEHKGGKGKRGGRKERGNSRAKGEGDCTSKLEEKEKQREERCRG